MTADIHNFAILQPWNNHDSRFVCELPNPTKASDYAAWYRWSGGQHLSDEIVSMVGEEIFNRLSFQSHRFATMLKLAKVIRELKMGGFDERRHLFNSYCKTHFNVHYGRFSFLMLDSASRFI
jgi:hypothetical protein